MSSLNQWAGFELGSGPEDHHCVNYLTFEGKYYLIWIISMKQKYGAFF